jgi:hypothetical protein
MPGILPHHAGWFRRVDFHSTEGVDAKPRLAKAIALTQFIGISLTPDQEWHWAIVQAREFRPNN